MNRLLIVLATCTLLTIALAPRSAAMEGEDEPASGNAENSQESEDAPEQSSDDPFGSSGENGNKSDDGASYTRTATFAVSEPPAQPVTDENIGYYTGTDGTTEVATGEPGPSDDCVDWVPPQLIPGTDDTYYAGYCRKWQVCGGERVDDVVSGEIAGKDAVGRYRDFLNQMVGLFASDDYLADAGLDDIDSVNGFLITHGLGEPPGADAIPVFFWCANYNGTVFDPVDLGAVSFSWDLTFDDVYDIPGIRTSLFAQLTAKLDLYNPEIGLVPPAEQGRTFVQWPTWMYLENPLEEEAVYTTNAPTDTFRLDLRATLLRVEWTYGNITVAQCSAAQMKKYTDSTHPIDDLPECHHIFTEAGSADLTTTIYYKIEEKIRTRPSGSLDDWPDIAWDDYLGTPTELDLETTIADYGVHEVITVNVVDDLTADQARAALAIDE